MMTKSTLFFGRLCTVGALGAAILGLTSQANAVSFNNAFQAFRQNTAGTSFTNMTASNTTFCYLSEVLTEETDGPGELSTCRLVKGAVVWTLEATLGATADADTFCRAICYNN
jgi:hypothetical protein